MPSTFISPLDLKMIFLNYFLGSTALFFGVMIMVYSYVAARMQMSQKVFLITLVVVVIILIGAIGQAIFLLIFLVICFVIFKWVGRIPT